MSLLLFGSRRARSCSPARVVVVASLVSLAAGALPARALADEPVPDPADVGVEPAVDDDGGAPVEEGAPLDPRLPPEPVADPYSDERSARDPADEAALPSGDAIEHEPLLLGEPVVPPFSAVVDCPMGTAERRTPREGGAELWCADGRGRRHGPFVRLYPSGSPKLRGSYLDGRRHGWFFAWYPSGRLEGKSSFKRGVEHGALELYYESGRPRSTTMFQDGQKHGPHRAWHENGKLAATGSYERGEASPGWAFYDEAGRAIEPSELASTTGANGEARASADDVDARRPSLSSKLTGAAGGAIGATAGVAIGVPVSLLLIHLRALGAVDAQGWLTFLLVPPLFAAAGGVLGTALLTRFPGPVMAGAGAAFGLPAGAALGALLGGAIAGVLSLGTLALGATADASLSLLLTGVAIGAVGGAAVGPGALGAAAGWLYADSANVSE